MSAPIEGKPAIRIWARLEWGVLPPGGNINDFVIVPDESGSEGFYCANLLEPDNAAIQWHMELLAKGVATIYLKHQAKRGDR